MVTWRGKPEVNMPDPKPVKKTSQQIQQELVEKAEKTPGVAEVIKAYGSLAPHIPSTAAALKTKVSYGTGGNE